MSLDPVVGCALLEGRRIAYQVLSDGPVDLLITVPQYRECGRCVYMV
ncbi:MAG: hypothetical protein U9N84_13420 [Actinomycetota bacterium]|nr:hypothetical protein [Actinomycetota bacterium]